MGTSLTVSRDACSLLPSAQGLREGAPITIVSLLTPHQLPTQATNHAILLLHITYFFPSFFIPQ